MYLLLLREYFAGKQSVPEAPGLKLYNCYREGEHAIIKGSYKRREFGDYEAYSR